MDMLGIVRMAVLTLTRGLESNKLKTQSQYVDVGPKYRAPWTIMLKVAQPPLQCVPKGFFVVQHSHSNSSSQGPLLCSPCAKLLAHCGRLQTTYGQRKTQQRPRTGMSGH